MHVSTKIYQRTTNKYLQRERPSPSPSHALIAPRLKIVCVRSVMVAAVIVSPAAAAAPPMRVAGWIENSMINGRDEGVDGSANCCCHGSRKLGLKRVEA